MCQKFSCQLMRELVRCSNHFKGEFRQNTHVFRDAKLNLQTDVKLVSIHRTIINCIPPDKLIFTSLEKKSFASLVKFPTTEGVVKQLEDKGAGPVKLDEAEDALDSTHSNLVFGPFQSFHKSCLTSSPSGAS